MNQSQQSEEMVVDYLTGKTLPNTGAELNRQKFARFLVEEKGYTKTDIETDAAIEFTVQGERYRSRVDLVVHAGKKRYMCVKCAAGSLGSWEREILAAARLLDFYQIPICVVTDGAHAIVLNTLTGRQIGEGLAAVPSRTDAESEIMGLPLMPFAPTDPARIEKERLIFKSYDSMVVNRA